MSETYRVERKGMPIQAFTNNADRQAWMQNHAIRKGDGTGRKPDVGVAPDGSRWVQLGLALVPELKPRPTESGSQEDR